MRSRSGIPPENLAGYDRIIATIPGVERRGATMPYTSVNGNMSSFLTPTGGLALRLSEGDRAAFLERHGADLHEAHGRVLREYVSVPDPVMRDVAEMGPWFAASFAYVSSLKPKPTARKAKT